MSAALCQEYHKCDETSVARWAGCAKVARHAAAAALDVISIDCMVPTP